MLAFAANKQAPSTITAATSTAVALAATQAADLFGK